MTETLLESLSSMPAEFVPVKRDLLDGPRHFRLPALQRRGWVVAPVPDCISEDEARRIAAVSADRNIRSSIASTTEAEVDQEYLRVPVTDEGLIAFEMNCHLRAFLLLPDRPDFALLHEGNYYWLMAGAPEIVTESLGTSPATALDDFLNNYVSEGDWPKRVAASLASMDRYRTLLNT